MSAAFPPLDVVVIGGGAAGYFAAIACAEANPARRVTLMERSSRVLAKVKISGGGRCNVTHACFDPAKLIGYYPRGGQALRGPFSRFQPQDTMAWFEKRGVELKTENDGRVFPTSNDSQTIIDCLVAQARNTRVTVLLNINVTAIQRTADGLYELVYASGDKQTCHTLILATGSSPLGWESAQALGHTIEPPVPSLFTFSIRDPRLEGLSGLSVPNARVTIEGTSLVQQGALLITHWGLSGPAILKLSAWGARALHEMNYEANVRIQWDADWDVPTLTEAMRALRNDTAKKFVSTPTGILPLPLRLWTRMLKTVGLKEEVRWADVSNAQMAKLCAELAGGVYRMQGKSAFKEEFVTCGGIRRDEVDFRTMESKRCPNLYFAGEVLDIDAVTGGFNFQNAWTTGWLAGKAAANDKVPGTLNND
jgi:predicted Rossmann fold flavoprotein